MKESRVRKTNNDTPESLVFSMDRFRRRLSRFQEFGILPEEIVVRVQGYILSIRQELVEWIARKKTPKS